MALQPNKRLFTMGAWERRRGVEKLAPPVLRCFTWPDEVFNRAKIGVSMFNCCDEFFSVPRRCFFTFSRRCSFPPQHPQPLPATPFSQPACKRDRARGGERHSQKQQHPNTKPVFPSLLPDCTSHTFSNDAPAIELFGATTFHK